MPVLALLEACLSQNNLFVVAWLGLDLGSFILCSNPHGFHPVLACTNPTVLVREVPSFHFYVEKIEYSC